MKIFLISENAIATLAFKAALKAGYGRIETTSTNIIVYESKTEWDAEHPAPPPAKERYIPFFEFKERIEDNIFEDIIEYSWSRAPLRRFLFNLLTSQQVNLNAARLNQFFDILIAGSVLTIQQKIDILA